jgi:hypothetical protein
MSDLEHVMHECTLNTATTMHVFDLCGIQIEAQSVHRRTVGHLYAFS